MEQTRMTTKPKPRGPLHMSQEEIREAFGMVPYAPGKAHARGRHTPGTMNRVEQRYSEHLDALKLVGDVLWWRFEQQTFKLGPDLRYTPDFMVVTRGMLIEFHECKGSKTDKRTGKQTYYATEDGTVKIRSAAQQFNWFIFKLCWWDKDTGEWITKEIES